MFDRQVIPRLQGNLLHDCSKFSWSYKDASEMLLSYLIDKNQVDIEKEDFRSICDFMRGVCTEKLPEYSKYKEKQYLFDIVVNKRVAIDVDKFD